MKVTLFNSNVDTNPKHVELSKVVALLKTEFMRTRVNTLRELPNGFVRNNYKKTNLPTFCFYGVYENGRKIDDLRESTGIMLFDFDDIKSEEYSAELVERIKSKLGNKLLLSFVSPNYGVKFAIKTDLKTKDNTEYRFKYEKFRKLFEKLLDITLDDNTSNSNRLCNLSYDSNAYYNEDADTIAISSRIHDEWLELKKKEDEERAEAQKMYDKYSDSINEHKKDIAINKAISDFRRNHDRKGERHRGLFILGMELFKSGCNAFEVERWFKSLGSSFTESCARRSAIDIEQTWIKNGRPLSKFVLNRHNPLGEFL
ncbi:MULTISPECIES: BT4734/BF3469 family protein [Vibrio]|uniref:BT4734/BF3469 family protein n=1 Tax=Vibrio TaxID=662 RepID=UPI0029648039|nr:BT4734/BF3469 family protein [Vibrio sp. Y159]MDW1533311.1 BT4734/BF3469 family protein [Vibrio sp. Y159]